MNTKNKPIIRLFVLVIFLILSANLVFSDCPAKIDTAYELRSQLRTIILNFLSDPSSSPYSIKEILDLLDFYKNEKGKTLITNCNTQGSRTGIEITTIMEKTIVFQTQCDDNEDNDGDGKIDLNDAGCASLSDDNEINPIITAVNPPSELTSSNAGTLVTITGADFINPVEVMISNGGIFWTQATANGKWQFVQGQTALAFNNKMWVIGAESSQSGSGDDIWSSSDGVTWTRETKNAGWPPRYLQTALAFQNKMWVLGGGVEGGSGFANDVWSSSDGVTWTRETKNAGWSPRYLHRSVVFNNKMWVLGGRVFEEEEVKNGADVWSSTDGKTWNLVISNAAFGPIEFHSALVFNNKMWVLGTDRRVWSSSDGVTWNLATSNGPPAKLDYVTVFDNKMMVMSGSGDVWSSPDGITWNKITLSTPWSPRSQHSMIVLNNKMWLIGGINVLTLNDVWFSSSFIPALDVTFVSNTELSAVMPDGGSGSVDVKVINPDGQSDTLANGFTYIPDTNMN